MSNQQFYGRVGTFAAHSGYGLCLLEYGVTDIVLLRVFAIGGCGMVVLYQLLQPRVQWVTASWCFIYVAVNVFQLAWLLVGRDDVPPLSWEESQLHGFYSRHIAANQFYPLLALGEWLWLVEGALLAEEGEVPAAASGGHDDRRIFFLVAGTCEVSVGGRRVAQLGPGSVVGEVGLLSDVPRPSSATVATMGSVRCLVVPVVKVRELLKQRPELRGPVLRILNHALASKVSAMNEQVQLLNYQAVLEVACTLDGRPGLADGVANYRRNHSVPAELHGRLLEEVPQCAHKPFWLQDLGSTPSSEGSSAASASAPEKATTSRHAGGDTAAVASA